MLQPPEVEWAFSTCLGALDEQEDREFIGQITRCELSSYRKVDVGWLVIDVVANNLGKRATRPRGRGPGNLQTCHEHLSQRFAHFTFVAKLHLAEDVIHAIFCYVNLPSFVRELSSATDSCTRHSTRSAPQQWQEAFLEGLGRS
jgi:hypothetical protein